MSRLPCRLARLWYGADRADQLSHDAEALAFRTRADRQAKRALDKKLVEVYTVQDCTRPRPGSGGSR